MKKTYAISVICLIMAVLISCSSGKETKPQPVLGTRSVAIIEKHGLQFKDLNKNGKLDKYEDWRLTSDERSRDLLSKMSLEEKAGFMLINSLNMVGTRAAEASEGKLKASDLSEGSTRGGGGGGQFGNRQGGTERTGAPQGNRPANTGMTGERVAGMGGSGGTKKVVTEFHNRHFILRSSESATISAEWANKLQELCESEPLGIPAIIASNPRNNITLAIQSSRPHIPYRATIYFLGRSFVLQGLQQSLWLVVL